MKEKEEIKETKYEIVHQHQHQHQIWKCGNGSRERWKNEKIKWKPMKKKTFRTQHEFVNATQCKLTKTTTKRPYRDLLENVRLRTNADIFCMQYVVISCIYLSQFLRLFSLWMCRATSCVCVCCVNAREIEHAKLFFGFFS